MNTIKKFNGQLQEVISKSLIKLTENSCSKCLFLGYYETQIPMDILNHEYKKFNDKSKDV